MAVRIATGAVAHIGGSEGFATGCRSRRNFPRNISRPFLPYKAMNLFPGRVLGRCHVQPEPVARSLTDWEYVNWGWDYVKRDWEYVKWGLERCNHSDCEVDWAAGDDCDIDWVAGDDYEVDWATGDDCASLSIS
ncbi:hypothetical protein EVAR_88575_1 [Eumeta japonica]|uniref:Uncharacterized protein n=1 Tax=Eumeta variegata TaxID=151549 RepID=A0A4C1WM07_EUMVA|nr:hypothetical protein EVAR_88575_1 [Eumeta japonica]